MKWTLPCKFSYNERSFRFGRKSRISQILKVHNRNHRIKFTLTQPRAPIVSRYNSTDSLRSLRIIQADAFRALIPCSDVVGYKLFGGPCHLGLHFTLKMEATWCTETLVPYHITTRSYSTEDLDFSLHRYKDLKSPTLKIIFVNK
jgi:hypothetical protein